ncbi:hypothetical protein GCM10022215_18050 [Nocardioides fonticola]|uniref:Uncharacterized protein n=1 Tax=Nocardioides fonticola TaxID=450363 RepID=A0ABP7XHW8_9ACTN
MVTLTGLAKLVDHDLIEARLLERAPRALDGEVGEGRSHVDAVVVSIAAEVTAIVGSGLAEVDCPKRDLAVRAIECGAAMELEADLYPEQPRAVYLRERYADLLKQLREFVDEAVDGNGDGVPSPVGSFPPAQRYPDPVSCPRPYGSGYGYGVTSW